MNLSYDVSLSGFICIPRNIISGLIKELGLSGFAKYLILLSQADFDKKHKNYSKIIRNDKKIGEGFGISSSAVYKARRDLTKKGFLNTESGVSSVPSMDAFDSKTLITSSKKQISITTEMLINWKKYEEEHQKYVDKLKDSLVQNNS